MAVSPQTRHEAALMRSAINGALAPFCRDVFDGNAFVGAIASVIGSAAGALPLKKRQKMLREINRLMRVAAEQTAKEVKDDHGGKDA